MNHTSLLSLSLYVTMAVPGFLVGLAYLAALRRTVGLLAEHRKWIGAVALTLGRITGAVVFFVLAAKLGAIALLAASIGFWMARSTAVRVIKSIE